MLLASHVVVGTMARGDVNRAGAGLGGDKICQQDLRVALDERMPGSESLQLAAFDFRQRLC